MSKLQTSICINPLKKRKKERVRGGGDMERGSVVGEREEGRKIKFATIPYLTKIFKFQS